MLRSIFNFNPAQLSVFLISFISAWHLLLATQAGLSVDEAHYALYALKPDWSYFDHPPMVGWLQIPFVALSQQDWVMRLAPISLYALLNYLLYKLSCQSLPNAHRWTGFWVLLLVNSAVMFQLLGLALLPETPFLIFALLTIMTILRLRQQAELKYWLWLGVWIGLAGLSKYTAITLVASIILLVIIEKRWRWLTTPGPWLAMLVTLLIITPVIYWNASHDWISFKYQLEHGTRDPNWLFFKALTSQAAQFIVYTPLLYLTGLVLMLLAFWRHSDYRVLAVFALPVIALFAFGSGHKVTLPHWTALAWLTLAPAVVDWLIRHWSLIYVRWLVYLSAGLALILTLFVNLLLVFPWLAPINSKNSLKDLYGWQEVANRAQTWQAKLELQTGQDVPLFVTNWTHASRLGWYAYPQNVYVTGSRFDQFNLWYGQAPNNSAGLIVRPEYADQLKLGQAGHFNSCRQVESLAYQRQNKTLVNYELYFCEGFNPVN